MSPRLLFLGPLFPENGIFRHKALSPAGNRWKLGLVGGLRGLGCEIVSVGHAPEPAFPRGKFWKPRETEEALPGVRTVAVGYANLPRVRHWFLGRHYASTSASLLRELPVDAIVTYNLMPEMPAAVRLLRRRFKLPWVSIVADADGEGEFWDDYRRLASEADGHAFLSYRSYEECPFAKRHHVDGGFERVRFSPDVAKERASDGVLRLGYTGMLSEWTGSALLGDMMLRLRDANVELHVCGRGDEAPLRAAAAQGARIVVHGLVSEEKLRAVCDQVDAFVNPRPSTLPGNTHNFPSKLLEYLSYGVPVISTYTPGIAPDYLPHLLVPASEDPAGLEACVRTLLGRDAGAQAAQRRALHAFLSERKTWDRQAQFFRAWLQRDLGI